MDVADDLEPDTSFPDCASCGSPVTMLTVIGPTEAIASPCGCHAPPALFQPEYSNG
ncbi:hypothetical protein [Natronorubrum aibiense]|uniref:hypothetical protein n=1 Tax=Natronorubrum aibiense TaxID=348826 RepID=UPI0014576B52|nr:hypothetical protein [Natronorubrum aibiense]